ncbi:hypothetical protein D9758_013024 [Tetrapyrgos nigripes]|uniref:Uncharacterized protein n=1 Tax=Tetrapyrgos nigripes TaxID=182062 RepID=A0A8H5FIC9_9AGAR|nr:hypothetical protein D9758_013024 [Tetrapyrgos nigripes]
MSDTSSGSSQTLENTGDDTDPKFFETLTLKYMKAHEPFDVYDFPQQYIPRPKYGYLPPAFILGAALTFPEYQRYAEQRPPPNSQGPQSIGANSQVPSSVPRRGSDGTPLLQKVWTKSDTPFLLPICSSYKLGKRFPTEECEALLDDLESAGIEANIDWYLREDYSQWADESILDWSQPYRDMVAKRKQARRAKGQ